VLLETTLEGLLAGYKRGKFAPTSIEELFGSSIAKRILQTDIPGQLAAQGIDEIMVPVCSSVADRSHLNPKFNYLTYNFVDVDWQIGQSHDFKALIDEFYGHGIQLVPDLIFAHQVKTPFKGSLDQMSSSDDGEEVFVDREAFLFRDYGTWMLNLSMPEIRKMLVEKVVAFITRYRLKVIRIDYVDGLILQYSNRKHNHAEDFIRELKAELQRVCPDVALLGETFEMANNEAVQNFIDVFYTPIGFSILEELYYPPTKRNSPLRPNVKALAAHIEQMLRSRRKEAFYAQLHDEAWYCPHIQQGRPTVSWAYGGQPAQLAKQHGESLVHLGLLERLHLLDYVRRMVRNVEAMTMFLSNFRYMYTPGVDSLSLGCLDSPGEWKVCWKGVSPSQMKEWHKTGLSSQEIFLLHDQHRSDMVQLRNIFRQYTKVDPDTHQPLTHPQIHHLNPDASLMSLFRANHIWLYDSLLVVFNLGCDYFTADHSYELPVPKGFEGKWEILFDGDWVDTHNSLNPSLLQAYELGTILETIPGRYSNAAAVLNLSIGARSLVVLRYRNP
jgi:1,4-alpha-glucan branching enzyme